jgi:hypothetical protein
MTDAMIAPVLLLMVEVCDGVEGWMVGLTGSGGSTSTRADSTGFGAALSLLGCCVWP